MIADAAARPRARQLVGQHHGQVHHLLFSRRCNQTRRQRTRQWRTPGPRCRDRRRDAAPSCNRTPRLPAERPDRSRSPSRSCHASALHNASAPTDRAAAPCSRCPCQASLPFVRRDTPCTRGPDRAMRGPYLRRDRPRIGALPAAACSTCRYSRCETAPHRPCRAADASSPTPAPAFS